MEVFRLDLDRLLSAKDLRMKSGVLPSMSLSLPVRGVLAGTALLVWASSGVAVSRHGAARPDAKATNWSVDACMTMLGDDPFGARDYAQAWQHHGGGRDAKHCQALAQLRTGQEETAAQMLDDLARLSAQDSKGGSVTPHARAAIAAEAAGAWLAIGQPVKAEDSATYGLGLAPGDQALLVVQARALLAQDKVGQAVQSLTALVRAQANAAPQVFVLLASAERRAGQMDSALQHVQHAIEADPQDPAALLERGIIRERRGDPAGARKDWLQVLDLAPDSHEADLARQDLDIMAADPDSQ